LINIRYQPKLNRVCVAAIALSFGLLTVRAFSQYSSAQDLKEDAKITSKRMADGKQWTTHNLNVTTAASYCYEDVAPNCRKYGRLYSWESARRACQSLGDGWRLPTDDEWRQLAKHYGGIFEDSGDQGKAAYLSLMSGGKSGFNALLGGGRSDDGQYGRLEAHGFYWTPSEHGVGSALYYNFGKGRPALYRQREGEKKQGAFSVRCVRE
jgi:uncharacterized protein (TIGR02145 family)